MHLNHPETIPLLPAPVRRKNFLPQNWPLLPKWLETTELEHLLPPNMLLIVCLLCLYVLYLSSHRYRNFVCVLSLR